MKKLGIIGGVTWLSTQIYLHKLNQETLKKLGKWNSCSYILNADNFTNILKLQEDNKTQELSLHVLNSINKLEKAGAKGILICSNSLHKIIEQIEGRLNIPIFNLIDILATHLKQKNIKKIAIIGSEFLTFDNFYKNQLQKTHAIDVIEPNKNEQKILHKILFNEIYYGKLKDKSESQMLTIIDRLSEQKIDALIVACTEFEKLLRTNLFEVPIIYASNAHIEYIVNWQNSIEI